jgi:hypothetical protein
MRRKKRNHSSAYKAKLALAAIKNDWTLAQLAEQFDVRIKSRIGVSGFLRALTPCLDIGSKGAGMVLACEYGHTGSR